MMNIISWDGEGLEYAKDIRLSEDTTVWIIIIDFHIKVNVHPRGRDFNINSNTYLTNVSWFLV